MDKLVGAALLVILAGCGASAAGGGATAGATTTGSSSSSASSSSGTSSSGASATSTASSSSTSGSSSGGSTGTTGAAPLRFAFTGDTRPSNADDVANYPTPVVQEIVASMSTKNLAFAIDTGDHVKIGKSDAVSDATTYAQQMMNDYTGATAALGAPWYLTMATTSAGTTRTSATRATRCSRCS